MTIPTSASLPATFPWRRWPWHAATSPATASAPACTWWRRNLLTAFASARFAELVVSNPPYVADDSPDVVDDVRRFEPATALFSGPAGLEHIERIVASAGRVLRPGGALVFEFGQGQAEAIGMRLDAEGWIVREIRRDLQGIARVAVATLAR